jgi:hypothetical protein
MQASGFCELGAPGKAHADDRAREGESR